MNVVLNNLRVKIEDLATAGHKVDFDQILRQDFENFRQDHNNLRQEHNNLRVDYNNFRQDHGNLRNEHDKLLQQSKQCVVLICTSHLALPKQSIGQLRLVN